MAQPDYPKEFSLFGPYDYGTAAPQLEPEYEPQTPERKKSKPNPKTRPLKKTTEKHGKCTISSNRRRTSTKQRNCVKVFKGFLCCGTRLYDGKCCHLSQCNA